MAGNTINIDLSVQDRAGTIKARTTDAKALNKELDKTVTYSKAASKAMAASENIEYGRARGGMGATGASARDFANQAQGLGGLVRVYATWAANIYAVTAAFNALSSAMNVQNMVQGLDQLGASSGQSLGSLAKRFADASGGAITLKDSMEAVVKASSSGLSEDQILQVGEVAKKASQALGLNMVDAVSRLTRGITKLEPELLDELGLFTKTGKAAEDYARKVGKSVDSLTDLERRQAFANAILKEGIDKFSVIDIPTNPYDKLAASLKNLTTQILTIFNKVLGPIVDFLSSSPTALFLGLVAFTAAISRQAIPVLRDWGLSLQGAADRSKKFYDTQAQAAEKARVARIKEIQGAKALELEALETKRYKLLERQEQEFQSAFDKKRLQQGVRDILIKDIQDITKQDLAYLDRLGKRTKIYADLAESIRSVKNINQEIIKVEQQTNDQIAKRPGLLTAAGTAMERAEQYRQRAATSGLISQAGADVGELGGRKAFSNLMQGIKDEKLRLIPGTLAAIGGSAAIAAGKVGALFTVLNKGLGIFGILFGAYELLSAVFGENSKQVAKYNAALEDLEEKTEAASKTTERYNNVLSVDSILAKATAFKGLSDSIKSTIEKLRDADQTASGFDRFMDGFLRFIGKGLQDNFAKVMAPAIVKGIKTLDDPALQKEASEGIATLLGLGEDFSIQQILDKLKGIVGPDAVFETGEAIESLFTRIQQKATESARPLNDVKEGFKAIEKSYQDLANSLLDKSPVTTYALDLGKQTAALAAAFKSTRNESAILNDILKDTSKLQVFPPAVQQQIYNAAQAYKIYKEQLFEAYDRQQEFALEMKAFDPNLGSLSPDRYGAAKAGFEQQQENINKALGGIEQVRQSLRSAITKAFTESLDLIFRSIDVASKKAVIQTQQALLGFIPKSAETIKIATELELRSIELRKEEILSVQRLISSNEQLKIQLELNRLTEEKTQTLRENPSADVSNLESSIASARQQQLAYRDPDALRAQVRAGQTILDPAAEAIMARTAGVRTSMVELNASKVMAELKARIETVEVEATRTLDEKRNELNRLKAETDVYFASDAFQRLSETDKGQQKLSRETAIKQKEDLIEIGSIQNKIRVQERVIEEARALAANSKVSSERKIYEQIETAAQKAINQLTEEATTRGLSLDAANRLLVVERNRELAIARRLKPLENEREQQDMLFKSKQQERELDSTMLQLEQERLEISNSLGNLSQQDYLNETRRLQSVQLALDYQNRIAGIKKQQADEDREIQKRQEALGGADQEEFNRLQSLRTANEAYYQRVIQGEDLIYKAKLKNKELNESLTERQKAYDDIFKNSFNSMADAMVNWMQTGKWAGKELINSLLADLARYELRLQMMQVYGIFRNALLGIPGASSGTPATTAGGTPLVGDFPTESLAIGAKGLYFDTPMQQFAKGGAFTNSIVNQPTLFKFAKGTGLMGEAGPEAIMPLKRDNQGNLGVRGGGQKTEVVINNYSGETATAQETTDSRGNRKVEVIIGEAAAGEMSRSGSQSQRAMKSTFGLRPQLIRR